MSHGPKWPKGIPFSRLAADKKVFKPWKAQGWIGQAEFYNLQADILEGFPSLEEVTSVYLHVLGDQELRIWIRTGHRRFCIGKDPKAVAKEHPELLTKTGILVTPQGPPKTESVTILTIPGKTKEKRGQPVPVSNAPESEILQLMKAKEDATRSGDAKLARKIRKHLRSLGYYHRQQKALKKKEEEL